jgi:hypothetical protein
MGNGYALRLGLAARVGLMYTYSSKHGIYRGIRIVGNDYSIITGIWAECSGCASLREFHGMSTVCLPHGETRVDDGVRVMICKRPAEIYVFVRLSMQAFPQAAGASW